MTFPLQVSGVMLNIDERWVFTKMQFQYALNTNYIVFAKIAAIGTLCALVLLSIMLLVCLAYSRNKVD